MIALLSQTTRDIAFDSEVRRRTSHSSNILLLTVAGPHRFGEEGVPSPQQGHGAGNAAQSTRHSRENVCCDVRPQRHAMQRTHLPATAYT